MRTAIMTMFFSIFLASMAFAGVTPSGVRVSADFGNLMGSANASSDGFGTVTASFPNVGSTTATLNGPIVDSAMGTITISGTASATASTGNQAAAIDVDFGIFADCDFSYAFTAALTQNDASSVPSSYGITAGPASVTAFLPLPGTSPIELMGTIAAGDTQSFGFLALLSDFNGDGFDLDFTYDLVLTADDPGSCDCFDPDPNAVPEPASLFVWSLLIGIGCVWVRRRQAG